MHKNRTCHTAKGFTLIELMIVIVIVGILASIAIPAYQNSVKKSRRGTAQGDLMSFAQAMERHFTTNGTYAGAAAGGGNTGSPTIFSTTSPSGSGGTAYYNLRIMAADASTFTLRAIPINGQAGDGIMELDNTGARRWDEDNGGSFGGTENDWEED